MKKPTLAAPRYDIQHVRLEEFEHIVYTRRHEEAATALLSVFQRLRIGADFAFTSSAAELRPALFARLASAITALLADPEFSVSESGYAKLQIEHALFEAIFEASAFESSDHVARLLSKNPAERDPAKFEFDVRGLALWLLVWCSSSNIDIDFQELFAKDKAAAKFLLPFWAALLAQTCVLSHNAHDRRNALLRLGPVFEDLEVPAVAIPPLSDAFMYSSYATIDDRHEVKRSVMRMLERSVRGKLPFLPDDAAHAERRRRGRSKPRPTMVVPLEHFGSFHAMFRCYAPLVRQLRQRFKLIGIGRASAFDAVSERLFDETIKTADGVFRIDLTAQAILEREPDIIYYPSLGMAMQWVALASVRLAPIQAMTLGHPATSMSAAMDYVLCDEGSISSPNLFSERVALLPDYANAFDRRSDLPQRRATFRAQTTPDAVDVAIPAMAAKLNVPFLECLRRIHDASAAQGTVMRFHFFPSQLGVTYHQISRHLRRWFPNCAIYPRADYTWYMETLGACDFVLVPFPFGGTNSTVDALWLGLPVVTLLGEQPHSRFDALLLRRVGLDHLVACSVDEYEAIALDMVQAPERADVFESLAVMDLGRELFDIPATAAGLGDIYGRAFTHLYRHHEDIQAAPGRTIHWKEFDA